MALCYNQATSMKKRFLPLALAAVALALQPCLVRAQTTPKGDKAFKTAVTQVNGITSRVVDNLWEATDHFFHEGDYYRIIALIRVCVAIDPSFVEAYSSGAWLLWSIGDTAGADAFLADGEARSPRKAEIAYEMGWHLYNTKRYDAALPYLEKGIKSPTAHVVCYTTLGHCYRQLKRYPDSVRVWKMVVQKFPTFTAGQSNLARVEKLARGTQP